MPKCEQCQYFKRTSYEYGEYECELFDTDDIDNKMITQNGCRYSYKTLDKYKKYNDMMLKEYWEQFGKINNKESKYE